VPELLQALESLDKSGLKQPHHDVQDDRANFRFSPAK
jgi:hypothetical protein